jgi:hypothetical protein
MKKFQTRCSKYQRHATLYLGPSPSLSFLTSLRPSLILYHVPSTQHDQLNRRGLCAKHPNADTNADDNTGADAKHDRDRGCRPEHTGVSGGSRGGAQGPHARGVLVVVG